MNGDLSLGSSLGGFCWGERSSVQNTGDTGDTTRGKGAQKTSSVNFTWDSVAFFKAFPSGHPQTPQPPSPPAAASEVVGLYCSQEVEWLRGPRRKQNDGQNSGKEEFSEPVLSLEAALIATFIICLL